MHCNVQCQIITTCVSQWFECKAVVMLCSRTSLTGAFKPVVNMWLPSTFATSRNFLQSIIQCNVLTLAWKKLNSLFVWWQNATLQNKPFRLMLWRIQFFGDYAHTPTSILSPPTGCFVGNRWRLALEHNLPGLLQLLRGLAMCCQTEDTTTPFNTLYLA